ncbi:MAG: hypothetical protein WCY43_03655 [Patescibacteria group bacterium]|nr:hypothetical protein [Patescibacteria group bacterium]
MGIQISSSNLFDLFKFMEEAELSIENLIDFCQKEAAKIAARNGKKFVLEIDYSKSISEMINAGKYSSVEDFGMEQIVLPSDLIGKKIEVEAMLFHFGFEISTQDVILEMKKNNYRPANIFELLSFGKKENSWPEESFVLAFGTSFINDFQESCFFCIDFLNFEKEISFNSEIEDTNWSTKCFFLGIKEG